MNLLFFFRVGFGILFIISAGQKLIEPYQNFLYVVQSYSILPPVLEDLTARMMPWMELFLGVFLVLGLWLKQSLQGSLALVFIFLCVVGQALWRQLPIGECGCFGELITLPLHGVLILDSSLFLLIAILIKNVDKAGWLSLDRYFKKD